MKTIAHVVTLIGLIVLAAGCKPSHRVDFKPALVSIDPGEGWKRLDIPASPPVCTPSLISRYGMINALVLDESVTDLQKAADKLQSSFATTSKAVQDTFKQEEFTTNDGHKGIHLSYSAKSGKNDSVDLHSHSFIFQNRRGRFVSISYITSPDVESAAVIAAVCKTLRVE